MLLRFSLALALLTACTTEGSGTTGSGGDGAGTTSGPSSSGTDTGGAGPSGTGGAGASAGAGTGGGTSGIPAFIAQGHMGRTTLSCDGGESFTANQSQDDAFRCWSGDGTDCDHNAFAGRGLAFGNGVWVATFGWGAPGTLRRSTNGVDWSVVATETPTFADVAFGKGIFVANNSPTRISTDGITWTDGGSLDLSINTRSITYVPHGEGLFLVTGESNEDRDIVRSTDGITWTHATTRPATCGQYVRNVAYGNGTIAIFSGSGHVCTSTDGGDTWAVNPVNDYLTSGGVFTGTEFFVWAGPQRFRSTDGVTWTGDAGTPAGLQLDGPVAIAPDGRFVGVHQSWDNYYEEQQFVFSDDGLNWQTASTFVGSHPINFLEFGSVEASVACGG